MKADKLHVPEKGAGALSDALAEKFRIRNEKEVLGMAALATAHVYLSFLSRLDT